MSLLLDALKKAADDKQKISGSGSQLTEEELTDKDTVNEKMLDESAELPVLTLDEESLTERGKAEELKKSDSESNAPEELAIENIIAVDERSATSGKYTVSDDALSMLIYKTNHKVKNNKRILIFGVAFLSLLVLVSGGVYYYQDMQTEIASMERKHRIMIQTMYSKTSGNYFPSNAKGVKGLIADTVLDKKPQIDRSQSRREKEPRKTVLNHSATDRRFNAAMPGLLIQKTNKHDPVGENLNAAWSAYNKGQYESAKTLYKKVLQVEKNNRDALLGLGAIAVLKNNNKSAREIYASLLEQDPRDPIATAAIASLRDDLSLLKPDESYLLSMLQKNPEAPHLHFSLANIYAQQNKWVFAQQHYFNAWQQDSDNADYIFNLAVSMDQLNKKQQAVHFYKDSLLKAEHKQISFSRETVEKRINDLSEL